jgi:MFS family permease
MLAGMGAGFPLLPRLGRRLLQVGVLFTAAGVVAAALTVTGARTASTWDLIPSLFLIGMGAGMSIGQLFNFILAGVSMEEVGSASGVLEAVQQLANSLGVAVLGTIFFSAFGAHLPTHALEVTAWACLVPLVACFLLIFRLPMQALEEDVHQ